MKKILLKGLLLFQHIFVKKQFYMFFKILYYLSIRGLGIYNYQNFYLSGELFLIKRIKKFYKNNKIVIFDIGANKGDYINIVRTYITNSEIYAFEPNPTHKKTLNVLCNSTTHFFNLGLGHRSETKILYDDARNPGSGHATLYKDVLGKRPHFKINKFSVKIITLDEFCEKNSIERIHFLKIDTEGNEYNILLGARKLLNKNKIDFIQFEFGTTNINSKIFFKSFFEILHKYKIYRMFPNGFISLEPYNPIDTEIFGFQNIIAINKTLHGI